MGMSTGQSYGTQTAGQGGKSSSTQQSTPQQGGGIMQLLQGMLQQSNGQVQSAPQTAGQGGKAASNPQMQYSGYPSQTPSAQGYRGFGGETTNPNTGGAGTGSFQAPSPTQGGGGTRGFGGDMFSNQGAM